MEINEFRTAHLGNGFYRLLNFRMPKLGSGNETRMAMRYRRHPRYDKTGIMIDAAK